MLSPLPKIASDPVRAEVGSAIAQVLGLPEQEIEHLRRLLGCEPILTQKPLQHRRG
ncbi:MAG: hypothetical protein N2253_08490 [Bacteroidia bacterium]|nr:hypothetical protein [Bacteroidia bacterium]MCX7764909.1 hypothetical protein [Bacteroidia bacterium]MDW8057537.1 hypothetical protein [Bacteroidia bacterium]